MPSPTAILVIGKTGQLARSLTDVARTRDVPLVAAGRPELDIRDADAVERAVASIAPKAVVNAAAYTAVDKAESEPELAPYTETDIANPLGAYGRSKLAGEAAVLDAHPEALVLRTSWLYSAYGHNFLTTMLGLARTSDTVRVVDDQHGAPTSARDLAGAILDLVAALTAPAARTGGVYHLTASGTTSWHGFAEAIFAGWQRRGHRIPALRPIATADYPTPARRPANSRLDCSKIRQSFGIALPPWSRSLDACLDQVAALRMETSS
jgi:dTDP-4-dehydrorhamnose reductase